MTVTDVLLKIGGYIIAIPVIIISLFGFAIANESDDPDILAEKPESKKVTNVTKPVVPTSAHFDDAVAALRSLGFPVKHAKEKVQSILSANPEYDIEQIIKAALVRR